MILGKLSQDKPAAHLLIRFPLKEVSPTRRKSRAAGVLRNIGQIGLSFRSDELPHITRLTNPEPTKRYASEPSACQRTVSEDTNMSQRQFSVIRRKRLAGEAMGVLVTMLLLLCVPIPQAQAHWEEHDLGGQYLFGYAGVEEDLLRYVSEVELNNIPANVETVVVSSASDDLGPRLAFLNSRGQRAVVILDGLLFRPDAALITPCGQNAWRTRLDFKAKFDNWLTLNAHSLIPQNVAMLVVNTEVNNRCVSAASLDEVTQYVGSRLPVLPTVAGYDATRGAQPLPEIIPASLAGVAFYRYHVLDPRTEVTYQASLNHLKARMTPAQRLVLVPDGFYDSFHVADGWPKWYLGVLALNYARLAAADQKVVGLVFFRWPGFFEFGETKLGVRDLPQSVRDRHREAACMLGLTNPFVAACP